MSEEIGADIQIDEEEIGIDIELEEEVIAVDSKIDILKGEKGDKRR